MLSGFGLLCFCCLKITHFTNDAMLPVEFAASQPLWIFFCAGWDESYMLNHCIFPAQAGKSFLKKKRMGEPVSDIKSVFTFLHTSNPSSILSKWAFLFLLESMAKFPIDLNGGGRAGPWNYNMRSEKWLGSASLVSSTWQRPVALFQQAWT